MGFYNDGVSAFLQTWTPHSLYFSTNNGSSKISLLNSTGYVGINTNTPSAQLDVNGTLRLRVSGAAAGAVLTSDASGNATWQQPEGITLPYYGSSSIANTTSFSQFYVSNAANSMLCGVFFNTSTTNTFPSLRGATNGSGAGIEGIAYGTGPSGVFNVSNNTNSVAALQCYTNGTGAALQAGVAFNSAANIALFQKGSTNLARIDNTGKGYFNGGTQNSGADVAEAFAVEGNRQAYEPGDVLIISTTTDRTVAKSNMPYSKLVVGVYATKPGVLLTERLEGDNLTDLVPMGVVGVIPTKVCLEGGAIHRGDLLVTSSTPGRAMKGDENRLKIGTVIGKALEDFTIGGTGLIKVLVNVK